jgi:hypothetical protein
MTLRITNGFFMPFLFLFRGVRALNYMSNDFQQKKDGRGLIRNRKYVYEF